MKLRMADSGLQFSAILPEGTSILDLKEHIICNQLCRKIEKSGGREGKEEWKSIDLLLAGRFLENNLLLKGISIIIE